MPRALRKTTSVSAEPAAETGEATPEEPAGDTPGAAGEEEHSWVNEIADVVVEEADEVFHAAAGIRQAIAGLDGAESHAPEASHGLEASQGPAVPLSHIPDGSELLSAIQRGEWQHAGGPHGASAHGAVMHSADVHVPDYLEGFGIGMPLLAAIINGISEGSRRASRDHHRKYLSASLERAHMLSKAPTTVNPSVSFAHGSCCLVVVGSDGVFRILPGGDRSMFKRTYGTDTLSAAFAQRWARFLSLRDDLQISQHQTAELAAWCELTGAKSLKRAPAVAFVFLAAPVRSADS